MVPAVSLGPRSLRLAASTPGAAPRDVPFFAGALHHFRMAQRTWPATLRALRSLGYPLVETAAPWGVHERAPGRMDFTGSRDLGAFLDACAAEGLWAVVQVGPRVGGQLLYDGLPPRIVRDAELQARTAAGQPSWILDVPRGYPAPSYASRRFLEAVGDYYRALAEVLAPRLYPNGPVVALGIDHALGGFHRAGPYDSDYHDDAIARWHAEERGAPPPRRFNAREAAALPLHLRWLAFRERAAAAALTALGALLDDAGLAGVPRLHGFAALEPVVYDVAAAERAIDVAGTAFFDGAQELARTRRRALYLTGSSRFPLAAPLAFGSFPWGPKRRDEDALASLLAALMHGVAGYTGHMAVARDGWLGAPIGEDGTARPALAEPLRRLHAALDGAGFPTLSRSCDVGLLLPRDYARLALAASRLGAVAHLAEFLHLEAIGERPLDFGLSGPIVSEARRCREALERALLTANLPFVMLDESAPDERLSTLRLLVVPTFDFLDAGLAARLRRLAHRGVRILSGPRGPRLDAGMQQADVALPGERFDAGLLEQPEALTAAVASAARAAGCSMGPIVEEAGGPSGGPAGRRIESALWSRPDGRPSLLFVANGEPRPRTARLELPPGTSAAIDALSGERLASLAVLLPPHGVRLFTLE